MTTNRSGDIRNIRDNKRGEVLSLPVNSKKVTRRVTPDLVSTYHMKVHERSGNPTSINNDTLFDRDLDPGESEQGALDKKSKMLLDYLIAHGKTADLFQGDRRYQIGESQSVRLSSAIIGRLVHDDKFEHLEAFLSSPGFNYKDLKNVSAATWRNFIKNAPIEYVDSIAMKKFPNSIFLGEISVLSNTLLRRGRNTLQYILPAVYEITKDIEFVNLPHQQLFNMSSMTVPSKVEPINRAMIKVVDTAGAQWVYNRSKKSNWIRNFLQSHDGRSIRVTLQGFPSKIDSSTNIFQISSKGLSNSIIDINPDDILKVLGGFTMHVRKKTPDLDDEMSVKREESWPSDSLVFPMMEDETTALISNVRSRITKFSNKVSGIKEISTSAVNVGAGEHGISEYDIRKGSSYTWDNMRSGTISPYRKSNEADVFNTSYPHPLVKYTALKYLGETDPDTLKKIGDMGVVTLPRKIVNKTHKG